MSSDEVSSTERDEPADRAPERDPARDEQQEQGRAPRGTRLRAALLAVLVLALVAGVAASAWLLSQRRGEPEARQEQREAVMAQARQFMLRYQTYGPDQLDEDGRLSEYTELVGEVLTPKYAEEFAKAAEVAEQLVAQSKVSRSAEVLGVGVETLDEDSATALVVGQISTTYVNGKGKETAAGEDLFRVVLDLVKVRGTWLVDSFSQVSEEER